MAENKQNLDEIQSTLVQNLAEDLRKDKRGTREWLSEIDAINKNAETRETETQKKLDESIRKAQKLYDERATTQDWLETAQSLAQAITQFGAARAGERSGRNLSGITGGPGIDYQARKDRAYREYEQNLRNIGSTTGAERSDEEKKTARELARAKEGLRVSERESDAALEYERRKDFQKMQQSLASAAQAMRERKGDEQDEKQLRRDQLALLNRDIQIADKKLQAGDALMNDLLREDLSSGGRKKLEQKWGATAAAAGIPLEEALDTVEKLQEEKPGAFSRAAGWAGRTLASPFQTEAESEAAARKAEEEAKKGSPENIRKSLYDSLGISRLRQLRDAQEAKRKKLVTGTKSLSPEEFEAEPTPGTGEKPVTVEQSAAAPSREKNPDVQAYADKWFSGDYEKAHKALLKAGKITE